MPKSYENIQVIEILKNWVKYGPKISQQTCIQPLPVSRLYVNSLSIAKMCLDKKILKEKRKKTQTKTTFPFQEDLLTNAPP